MKEIGDVVHGKFVSVTNRVHIA